MSTLTKARRYPLLVCFMIWFAVRNLHPAFESVALLLRRVEQGTVTQAQVQAVPEVGYSIAFEAPS